MPDLTFLPIRPICHISEGLLQLLKDKAEVIPEILLNYKTQLVHKIEF